MSFGTGVLVGAALLDLFPSALSAAESSGSSKALVFPIAALGGLLIFCIGEAASRYRANKVGNRAAGRVSASFLIVHSTLDGTATPFCWNGWKCIASICARAVSFTPGLVETKVPRSRTLPARSTTISVVTVPSSGPSFKRGQPLPTTHPQYQIIRKTLHRTEVW